MTDRRRALWLILALVAARAAWPLLLVNPEWEFHRDELLYFAMGDHLAWRMQFPPFIALLARASSAVFGDSVFAARVPAALGGAALTGVVLLLLRRLGSGAWGLLLATLGLALAPVFLRSSLLFQPVIFDQFWATLAVAALVLAAAEREPRWWLLVGAALGLGLLTKMSALMYGLAVLVVALLHPTLRAQLRTRWPWLAGSLASVLALLTVLGQVAYDWPFLQQLAALKEDQFAHTTLMGTLWEQPQLLMPAAILVLSALTLGAARRSALQVAGGFALALLALVLWQGGKGYYAAPGYPVLIGLGALAVAESTRLWVRIAVLLVVLAIGLPLVPMGVPVLAPGPMARFASSAGFGTTTNRGERLDLPQDYADMLGWRAQAEAVARAYAALTPDEQAQVIILGGNYGQAGALARYAPRFGYPYPVSTTGDFHAWGLPEGRSGDPMLVLSDLSALGTLEAVFSRIEIVAELGDKRSVPEERDLRIFLAREPKVPLLEAWAGAGPNWH